LGWEGRLGHAHLFATSQGGVKEDRESVSRWRSEKAPVTKAFNMKDMKKTWGLLFGNPCEMHPAKENPASVKRMKSTLPQAVVSPCPSSNQVLLLRTHLVGVTQKKNRFSSCPSC
jgi:hypothetical protein